MNSDFFKAFMIQSALSVMKIGKKKFWQSLVEDEIVDFTIHYIQQVIFQILSSFTAIQELILILKQQKALYKCNGKFS